jgi:hypothetical protein
MSLRFSVFFFFALTVFGIQSCESDFKESPVAQSLTIDILQNDSDFRLVLDNVVEFKAILKGEDSEVIVALSKLATVAKSRGQIDNYVRTKTKQPAKIIDKLNQFDLLSAKLRRKYPQLTVSTEKTQAIITHSAKSYLASKHTLNKMRVANDCGGTCSQQFNIDMDECNNGLAAGIGISLLAAVGSPLATSGGLVATGIAYLICEDHAYQTLGTCFDGCK